MKKRIILTSALILIFLTGLSVLLYPLVSDYVNSLSQSKVIAQYSQELQNLSEADYSDIINAANEYNQSLLTKQNRFTMSAQELEKYHSILDFTGRGVIGTLEIPVIKVRLPIYLGTNESTLQVGLGHLEGSSLPVGGIGTHAVISGHRGLPSSTLLTNADKLEEGDTFTLNILNEKLTYQVDQIRIVLPNDLEYLGIDPDKDYCTLVTCTPLGINSHRLLIRGIRIFPQEETKVTEYKVLRSDARVSVVAGYVVAGVPVLLISGLYTFIKSRRKR